MNREKEKTVWDRIDEIGFENRKTVGFEELLGKTITKIFGAEEESEAILIVCSDGSMYVMYHDQDCCERVDVDDICGNIENLIGKPLLKAEEVTSNCTEDGCPPAKDEWDDSYTWTFYHLATIKGYVTIRWYGTSNGWYSERVDFVRIK